MNHDRLFCFGLGYSAGFLARQVAAEGWRVRGTTRDPLSGQEGLLVHRFDRRHPLVGLSKLLAGATHVLISVPPAEDGCPILAAHGQDFATLQDLLWVGYLSTTNVYGDRNGGWVDEEFPCRPSGERGQRRLEAEAGWLDLHRRHGVPVHVFRLAGIYGPRRNPLVALKAGSARRVAKPGQVFSRIHVEDLAAILRASMARPRPGGIYNVCDDEAAPPEDVVAYAARLLGIAPPPLQKFGATDLSPFAKSFYADNKRVSNRRIKDELGVVLRYPTYRDGLKALNRAGV